MLVTGYLAGENWRHNWTCSHSVSIQSLAMSSTPDVGTSVMSEMIGPEVTGASAENRLAAA